MSAASGQDLQQQIAQQGDKVRSLKCAGASTPKEQIDAEIAKLLDLKKQLSSLSVSSPSSSNPSSSKKGKGNGNGNANAAQVPVKFTLKTPKGTRDWDPLSMSLRSHIFKVIESVFKTHGAVTIDTPVFELKEILSGKYGEDSKLIYDLQDQGGELCSLRYDLTVPFARFVAMNPSEYGNIKRYHIAKVYRRDQPAMQKGRFREFYQCDFDISGSYDPLLPDSETLHVLTKTLESLGITSFTIKLNHRALLDGIFAVCGVPDDKIRTISSAVDKLDKSPWSEVKKEMLEKGLDDKTADAIGVYVSRKGKQELLEELLQDEKLTSNESAKRGLEEVKTLFEYLDVLGVSSRISFDLSLARGLDYYTGLIYEAITEGSAPPPKPQVAPATDVSEAETAQPGGSGSGSVKAAKASKAPAATATEDDDASASVGVGSIAAGGRYDNLVGMFSGSSATSSKGKSSSSGQVPCVGVSIGVERVFSIMMSRLAKLRQEQAADSATTVEDLVRSKETECFIVSMGSGGMIKERMQVAAKLWEGGIKTEYAFKLKPKMQNQFATVAKESIPFVIILAPQEWAEGQKVRVKEQKGKGSEEGESKGDLVDLQDLVAYLKQRVGESRLTSTEVLRRVMGVA
ncbi:unnamed protein product [Jaminaea pallidilutea]